MQEKQEAAGLGFEPRLTDPKSFSFRDTGGHGGIGGDKTALLSGIGRPLRDTEGQGETPGCGQIAVKTWSPADGSESQKPRKVTRRRLLGSSVNRGTLPEISLRPHKSPAKHHFHHYRAMRSVFCRAFAVSTLVLR